MGTIAKNSVYKNPDGTAVKGSVLTPFGMHLTGALEDEYLTESMWIRCDDMDSDTIAAYDALPDDDIQKLSLQYKLAKIKASADDKTFATDTQIDSLFGACDTTPEQTGYTLVMTDESNPYNAAVYNAFSALTFMEDGLAYVDSITVIDWSGESEELRDCFVSNQFQAEGSLWINNAFELHSDGMFLSNS